MKIERSLRGAPLKRRRVIALEEGPPKSKAGVRSPSTLTASRRRAEAPKDSGIRILPPKLVPMSAEHEEALVEALARMILDAIVRGEGQQGTDDGQS